MAYQRKIHHRDEHCLNCGYPIVGDFCAKCGQKAHLHKDSFWHMVVHFAGDYFHYDNKFWLTIKTLVFAPGQITLDYNSGKRARYLNPIQLYIFITTVFFLIFYGLIPASEGRIHIRPESLGPPTTVSAVDSANAFVATTGDSLHGEEQTTDSIVEENQAYQTGKMAGSQAARLLQGSLTVHEYDSIQKQLPASARDGWFRHWFKRKIIAARNASHDDPDFQKHITEKAFHSTPKLFFVLLPFFAFLLWLLYNKRKFLYIDHIVFSIHFHSFWFLMLTLVILLNRYIPVDGIGVLLFLLFALGIGIYLIMAMKRVYGSSWFKTIVKQVFIFFVYIIGFIISSILILSITFLQTYS